MSDKKIISIIHDVLQNRDKWYLDHSITDDCPELQDIAEKAKEFADARLSELSAVALYARYRQWLKSEKIIPIDELYFISFLSDVAFDLGMKALDKEEKAVYDESIAITFNLI